jgi:hypothetical protein
MATLGLQTFSPDLMGSFALLILDTQCLTLLSREPILTSIKRVDDNNEDSFISCLWLPIPGVINYYIHLICSFVMLLLLLRSRLLVVSGCGP